MAQSLETPPTPETGASPSASNWERDEKAWNVPRRAAVATVSHSEPQSTDNEGLEWKDFVATYFPGTSRHNFKAIVAYSDYKRSFRVNKRSASEPDPEAPSIEVWENEGGSPSAVHARRQRQSRSS
jgi:hypothetical protein